MITLDIAPYCQGCNSFEAETTKLYNDFSTNLNFMVRCAFRDRCAIAVNHLRNQENKKEEEE